MPNMLSNKFMLLCQFIYIIFMSDAFVTESNSNEVKVRLKHRDWEVEITCKENKLKRIVEDVISGLDSSAYDVSSNGKNSSELNAQMEELKSKVMSIETLVLGSGGTGIERRSAQKIGMTCRSLLDLLLSENYFNQERQLGQIHEEISRRGYNYDRTAVSHSLTDLVRERMLARVGTIRNYRYIQKEYIGTE
jgi:hypothetical protein